MEWEKNVRDLLIETMHSSAAAEQQILAELSKPEFVDLLLTIAIDAADYGGDAPTAAGFYLTKIQQHCQQLLKATVDAFVHRHQVELSAFFRDRERGHNWANVVLALARFRSIPAQSYLQQLQKMDEWRELPQIVEATCCYQLHEEK